MIAIQNSATFTLAYNNLITMQRLYGGELVHSHWYHTKQHHFITLDDFH